MRGALLFRAVSSLLLKTLEKKGMLADGGRVATKSRASQYHAEDGDQLPTCKETMYKGRILDARRCVTVVAGRQNLVRRKRA